MKERSECDHPSLMFASGDYYLFCHDCGAKWATIVNWNEISPQSANQGVGAQLSGQKRNK